MLVLRRLGRDTYQSWQELTHWIKQDIAKINKDIASLQAYVRAQKSASSQGRMKQVEEHNNNVVMMLQSKLASTSMSFKDVLEIRTQVRLCSRK